MKSASPFAQNFEQLPSTLPIFPLRNAVFLPGGYLPLNIFEPRYLNMLQDAMRTDQLIGMIQPRENAEQSDLYDIGCAGRVIRYEETEDGRLQILLAGLCRFKIQAELPTTRGYRLIQPNWSDFADDFITPPKPNAEAVLSFKGVLRAYLEQNDLNVDWEQLEEIESEDMINSLFNALPIDSQDKQILIETSTLADRIVAFTAILKESIEESSSQRH